MLYPSRMTDPLFAVAGANGKGDPAVEHGPRGMPDRRSHFARTPQIVALLSAEVPAPRGLQLPLGSVTSLQNKTDAELVAHYGEVMSELLQRGVVRSGNNPVADMAERVIADYHGVDPEPPNSKSYDVVTRDGATIQVRLCGARRARGATCPHCARSTSISSPQSSSLQTCSS